MNEEVNQTEPSPFPDLSLADLILTVRFEAYLRVRYKCNVILLNIKKNLLEFTREKHSSLFSLTVGVEEKNCCDLDSRTAT